MRGRPERACGARRAETGISGSPCSTRGAPPAVRTRGADRGLVAQGVRNVSLNREEDKSPSNDAARPLFHRFIAFSAPAIPIFKTPLRGPRQTVNLPSQDEVEDDESENADRSDWRERVNQNDSCCYDPNQAEPHTHPAKALAKRRGPEHSHAEGNEADRQENEPHEEQRIEDALGRLPHENEGRLILGRCPRSVIEVGDWGGSDMRESSGREHAETHNAQNAPESAGAWLVSRRARYKAKKWATHKMRTTR
jgi:hypothetical protein